MKLRFIAATLADGYGHDLYYGGRFEGTPSTPIAIVDLTKDSASILPDQYKSHATAMNTVVKDYKNDMHLYASFWRVQMVLNWIWMAQKVSIFKAILSIWPGPTQDSSYTVSYKAQ